MLLVGIHETCHVLSRSRALWLLWLDMSENRVAFGVKRLLLPLVIARIARGMIGRKRTQLPHRRILVTLSCGLPLRLGVRTAGRRITASVTAGASHPARYPTKPVLRCSEARNPARGCSLWMAEGPWLRPGCRHGKRAAPDSARAWGRRLLGERPITIKIMYGTYLLYHVRLYEYLKSARPCNRATCLAVGHNMQ